MNKEEVRQKMLDIVGDIFHAHAVATAPRAPFTFDGLTWKEAKDMINKAFDGLEPDHPKVKLPREVGEELDDWMADNQDRLVGRIGELIFDIMTHEPKLTNVFCFVGDSEENYFKIIDAYRYGWKAEPEELFYVKAPENWKADGGGLNWLYKPSRGGVDVCSHTGESDEQFTRAELKQYHLDNDIFTLVPVEEEK